MALPSVLESLIELDLMELLQVQNNVTRLIEEKVLRLNRELDNKKEAPDNKENVQELEDDTDDFLLTQFDQVAREKLLNVGENEVKPERSPNVGSIIRGPDLSSPLKGTQSLPDSLGSPEGDLQIFHPKDGEKAELGTWKNILQPLNAVKQERSPRKVGRKKIRLGSPTKKATSPISLNVNPVTKKAWILEDFRANENVECSRRGRKNLASVKLNKFYRAGGRPPQVHAECGDDLDSSDYEFENLRHRSKSPPGFGRLDFPNTQERVDDKRKSQQIIHKKTKQRFMEATSNNIPPEERQFIFKNNYLNRLIEDGAFTWDDENLKIFCRK